jgi:hypothetical protein
MRPRPKLKTAITKLGHLIINLRYNCHLKRIITPIILHDIIFNSIIVIITRDYNLRHGFSLPLLYRLVFVGGAAAQDETTYAFQSQTIPALTASLPHLSFLLYLSSRALGQHLLTQSRHHAATVRSLFLSYFTPSLYLYLVSIQSISDITITIQNSDTA